MLLAGLQKTSLIDYPGKISCVLFTTGCNFICPYCHNAALARGEYPSGIELNAVLGFLKSRRGLLDGVTITGGEPTLSSGIVALCRAVKSLGYPLKLDTNGSRPEILEQILSQDLADYIAMDIKAPLDAYAPFNPNPKVLPKLMASIRIIMAAAPSYEFRTTCVRPFINASAIETIAQTIRGARCFVLQTFKRPSECLDPTFARNADPTIGATTMQRYQSLARPLVERCIIR